MLDEVHEPLDRGQPRVAGAGAVAPYGLQVCEKGEDERRVEVLEVQGRGGHGELAAREREQEPERVRVRVARMRTGRPLYR